MTISLRNGSINTPWKMPMSTDMLTRKGKYFHRVSPLGYQLKSTNDCSEKENQPPPGMGPFPGYKCQVISLETMNIHTPKKTQQAIFKCFYIYTHMK